MSTSDLERTFSVGSRIRIEAGTGAGDIVVSPGSHDEVQVRVEDGDRTHLVEQSGDVIYVRPVRSSFFGRRSGGDVHLAVPEHAELSLSCASGDVMVNVDVREVDISTASGDIRVGRVQRSASLRSASGDVTVDDVGDQLDVASASGSVRVGSVGRDLTVATGSGDVVVDRVGASADVKTASGDVTVFCFAGADMAVKSMSGDIRVGVPPRRLLEVDLQTLSGELRNQLPEGDGSPPEASVVLRFTTVSGDIILRGA